MSDSTKDKDELISSLIDENQRLSKIFEKRIEKLENYISQAFQKTDESNKKLEILLFQNNERLMTATQERESNILNLLRLCIDTFGLSFGGKPTFAFNIPDNIKDMLPQLWEQFSPFVMEMMEKNKQQRRGPDCCSKKKRRRERDTPQNEPQVPREPPQVKFSQDVIEELRGLISLLEVGFELSQKGEVSSSDFFEEHMKPEQVELFKKYFMDPQTSIDPSVFKKLLESLNSSLCGRKGELWMAFLVEAIASTVVQDEELH